MSPQWGHVAHSVCHRTAINKVTKSTLVINTNLIVDNEIHEILIGWWKIHTNVWRTQDLFIFIFLK